MIKKYFHRFLFLTTTLGLTSNLSAQRVVTPNSGTSSISDKSTITRLQLNTITTAVPFLRISPDSRAGALGDVGVSTSPDANSIHWNPAKLAFLEDEGGVSLSYSPWLRNLVGDISLSYLSAYKKLNDISTLGASLRYFSLGEINFTDINGQSIGNFTPNEWALDVA